MYKLSTIMRHARQRGIKKVTTLHRAWVGDPYGGRLHIEYLDGSTDDCLFASVTVLERFVHARRSWRGAPMSSWHLRTMEDGKVVDVRDDMEVGTYA